MERVLLDPTKPHKARFTILAYVGLNFTKRIHTQVPGTRRYGNGHGYEVVRGRNDVKFHGIQYK